MTRCANCGSGLTWVSIERIRVSRITVVRFYNL
jgi:hypothetical protein